MQADADKKGSQTAVTKLRTDAVSILPPSSKAWVHQFDGEEYGHQEIAQSHKEDTCPRNYLTGRDTKKINMRNVTPKGRELQTRLL